MIEGLGQVGIHLPSLAVYTVNFLVLWAVLHMLAVRPFLRRVRERARRLEGISALEAEASRLRDEAQQTKDAATQEAVRLRATAHAHGEQLRQDLARRGEEQGRLAGERQVHLARMQSRGEMERLHAAFRESFADIVVAACETLLKDALQDLAARDRLLVRALDEIAAVEWRLPPQPRSGYVEVRSAHDLPPDIRERVGRLVSERKGPVQHIFYVTDPRVIGGMSIRIGSALVDATVRERLRLVRDFLRGWTGPFQGG